MLAVEDVFSLASVRATSPAVAVSPSRRGGATDRSMNPSVPPMPSDSHARAGQKHAWLHGCADRWSSPAAVTVASPAATAGPPRDPMSRGAWRLEKGEERDGERGDGEGGRR